ncbi:MAG: folylpolyglutamate synthase/dihydrofolate synthase family protein [Methanomassiliicoccales archaeon]|jgi:dihydrofolate synthase/folylpolyglutamate synthase|nr:folylpolyglutamate synthase/dihydrofolate synthase family protein [Methanomassiliicoccales archaeon]
MSYQETLNWLFSLENMGIKLGLENTIELLKRLGDPHLRFRSVHIAGTKGKGSVCAMISSILQEAGYKVGLYTSPHLVDFRERIQINRTQISESELLRLIEEIRPIAEEMASVNAYKRLTFFEITTALAFLYFADKGVDEAVIEVGMGGRLDATNVIYPDCSGITKIGLEHTQYLGDTLGKIAFEKAGIVKPGVPVIAADGSEEVLNVIRSVCRERNAPLKIVGSDIKYDLISTTLDGTIIDIERIGRVHVPLIGSFQALNAAIAYGCIQELIKKGIDIPDSAIVRGFSETRWPGRFEILSRSPLVIFDATHTPDGAAIVSKDLQELVKGRIILVLGVLNDKDIDGLAKHLGKIATVAFATAPKSKRAYPAHIVADHLKRYCSQVETVEDVGDAVETALRMASVDDTVFITGSLYTIGEAKVWWDSHEAHKRDFDHTR